MWQLKQLILVYESFKHVSRRQKVDDSRHTDGLDGSLVCSKLTSIITFQEKKIHKTNSLGETEIRLRLSLRACIDIGSSSCLAATRENQN